MFKCNRCPFGVIGGRRNSTVRWQSAYKRNDSLLLAGTKIWWTDSFPTTKQQPQVFSDSLISFNKSWWTLKKQKENRILNFRNSIAHNIRNNDYRRERKGWTSNVHYRSHLTTNRTSHKFFSQRINRKTAAAEIRTREKVRTRTRRPAQLRTTWRKLQIRRWIQNPRSTPPPSRSQKHTPVQATQRRRWLRQIQSGKHSRRRSRHRDFPAWL